MAYYSIIVYSPKNSNDIHKFVKTRNEKEHHIQIKYYGMCVKGDLRDGSSAVGRIGAIIKVEAKTPQDLIHVLEDSSLGGWENVIENAYNDLEQGKGFDTGKTFDWNSDPAIIPTMIKKLGKVLGIACIYKFGENDANGQPSRVFTYGDEITTIQQFNTELRGEVTAMFKDMSGTGIPSEFQIGPESVKIEAQPDGKTRLCFAVHMKASKKNFADVGLQTKLNELRKDISVKDGVDVDIVDIRSTIEYS